MKDEEIVKKMTELTLISLVAIGVMVPAKSMTHGYMFEDSYNAGVIAGELIQQGYSIEDAFAIADAQVYGIQSSQSSDSNMYPYMDRECN